MSSAKQHEATSPDVAARAASAQPETQSAEAFDEVAHPSPQFLPPEAPRQALTRGSLPGLQRAIGNRAVARLLDGKPGINSRAGTSTQSANSARQAPVARPVGGPTIQRAGEKDPDKDGNPEVRRPDAGPQASGGSQKRYLNFDEFVGRGGSSAPGGSQKRYDDWDEVIGRRGSSVPGASQKRYDDWDEVMGRRGSSAPGASTPPVVAEPEIRVIETFMEQRKVSAHYTNEKTIQRPDLIKAIKTVVGTLKQQYRAYKAAEAVADPTTDAKRALWQKTLVFLRKQDVVVTDAGDFDEASLAGRLVEYDETAEKQASTRVSVAGGTLKRSSGEPVDTTDSVTFQRGQGWEIFVMSPGGDIHMASHKIGKYHHSSLLAGGNVAAAGMMRVTGGTLQELNNHSGHYQPKEQHLRQVVRHLQANGVPLNFTLEVMGVYKGPAADYMKAQVAGGKGGEEAFEKGSTEHIIRHFFVTKGAVPVRQAIESAGWTWVNLSPGQWIPQKPDGAKPTHKEVRDLLTAHFGEQAAPNVTQD